MTDVTLSSAVRSNLLSLQNTADMMSKTQERLATGLKVNSALDNPTNFFTASALNSRASDLGRLLDGVSNATQTLEAADNGISAITKLVESAQATARQALQTPATIEEVTGAADAATLSGTGFTGPLDLTGGATAATSGELTGSGFGALNLSGGGTPAVAGSVSSTDAYTNIDLSGADTLTVSVDVDGAGSPQTITIDAAAVTQANGASPGSVADDSSVTQAEFVALLNQELSDASLGVTAAVDGGNVSFTSDTPGGSSEVAVGTVGGTLAAGSGLDTLDTVTSSNGAAAGAATDSLTFTIDVDNGTPANITIDAAALDTYDAANVGNEIGNRASITGEELAAVINQELGAASLGATASFGGGELTITSDSDGATSEIDITAVGGTVSGGSSGLAVATDAGDDATASTNSVSFDVTLTTGGTAGTAQTVSFDAAAATAAGFTPGSLSAENIASLINDDLTGATASVDATSGEITITEDTTGTGSGITIGTVTETAASGATGITAGTDAGADQAVTDSTNPARAEFVEQYNELMGQIDELAEDSGFNGVNLLDGDALSVIFNEDGSSTLSITGVDFDAAGLGLGQLGATALDTDASINATLDTLDTAVTSLRSQASEFGSNLSIVETREDFTKSMINTLETGAANLTLADTNEEGANLLALQTRQQLSSTALSLASQADQNVLRLF